MTAVQDTFPHLRQKKTWVVLFVCLSGFLGGLIICTRVRMMVVTGPFLISKVTAGHKIKSEGMMRERGDFVVCMVVCTPKPRF